MERPQQKKGSGGGGQARGPARHTGISPVPAKNMGDFPGARKKAQNGAFFTFAAGPWRCSRRGGPRLTKKELPKCPIAVTMHLLGGKWELLIIRNLLKRPWCFNELKRDIAGISHKMLTASLRELERDRLIRREEISEPRKCVQYSLTELGATLCPVFDAMRAWGEFYKQTAT